MSCRDKLGLPLQHLPLLGTTLSQILNYASPITSNIDTLTNAATIIGKASDLIQQKLESSATNAKFLGIQRRIESDVMFFLVFLCFFSCFLFLF